jgi:hypothetical protein
VLVMLGVLLGSGLVAVGALYGARWLGAPTGRYSFVFGIFLVAFVLLTRVGGRILWPSAGELDRTVPMPKPTRHQRLWRIGHEIKSWVDPAIVALLAIGGAAAAGVLAHDLGFSSWAVAAVVVAVWITGIVAAECLNAWIGSKLERYRPPSEADALLKTFD